MQDTRFTKAFFTFKIRSIQLHGTCVVAVSITPIRKVTTFPKPTCKKLSSVLQHYVLISYGEFRPTRTLNVESMDINSFTSPIRVWFSLRRFSRNSKWINKFVWKSPVPNVIQLGEKNVKNSGNISAKPLSRQQLALHRFSQNSSVLHGIMCITSTPNFT